MRLSAIQELMEGLDRLSADEDAKRQFRRLVSAIAAQHGLREIERTDRVDFARRLHDLRTSRPTIRDRLIAKYGISKRQAYRVIHESLQLCQKQGWGGTVQRENQALNIVGWIMEIATINLAQSAAQKIATGALMTIEEVAARFDVSSQTVHRMPLPSIRLGRSLRFDPRDVNRLIEESTEAIVWAR
jgi:hypothetical protein